MSDQDNQPNSTANNEVTNTQLHSDSRDINNSTINDDKRIKGDWKSRWDNEAIFHIRIDACYVGIIFILTLVLMILTWRGTTFEYIANGCEFCVRNRFNQFAFFFLGGVLGGTLFSIKYLYKVVARGYWNIDRRLWRIFSPFLSGGLALAIGTLIDSGMIGLTTKSTSMTSYFAIGFISGYFADSASAKMQEIADTIFGASSKQNPSTGTRPPPPKVTKG